MTETPDDLRERFLDALVRNMTNGLCPANGPCDMCDCFDPEHRQDRAVVEAAWAAVVSPEIERLRELSEDYMHDLARKIRERDALQARLDAASRVLATGRLVSVLAAILRATYDDEISDRCADTIRRHVQEGKNAYDDLRAQARAALDTGSGS